MQHDPPDRALLELLRVLEARRYHFVTPLNATYRLVRSRPGMHRARDLRDMLGWSLPFAPGSVDPDVEDILRRAGCLAEDADGLRAAVRVSAVQNDLFIHSAYPARDRDSVFLGPDTYRFAEFLGRELAAAPRPDSLLDLGAGAGVGGVVVGRSSGAAHVVLSDVNPLALRMAKVNAAHAGIPVRTFLGSGLADINQSFDLIVSNPPFIAAGPRIYSDGGERGYELSLSWATEAITRLAPGGRLLMYTGAPILRGGDDPFRMALAARAEASGCAFAYRELDPDIFGRELRRPAYADVERIAAVGVDLRRR